MKHIITLVSALVFISATVQADDIKRNKKHKNQTVSVAPFVWGDPAEDVPVELMSPSDTKMKVAVAPFVWGDADDAPQIIEEVQVKVPVAPFIFGNPEEEITLDLKASLAVRASK